MENNVDIVDGKTFVIKETEVKKYSDKDPFKILVPAWLGKKLRGKKIEVTIKIVDE
ncbi:MAG: hypothetical protein J7K36_05325 [Archaeoglobaceae archaeon]|nr:hypothetical protein [Archaeoglobaceae archaeon]